MKSDHGTQRVQVTVGAMLGLLGEVELEESHRVFTRRRLMQSLQSLLLYLLGGVVAGSMFGVLVQTFGSPVLQGVLTFGAALTFLGFYFTVLKPNERRHLGPDASIVTDFARHLLRVMRPYASDRHLTLTFVPDRVGQERRRWRLEVPMRGGGAVAAQLTTYKPKKRWKLELTGHGVVSDRIDRIVPSTLTWTSDSNGFVLDRERTEIPGPADSVENSPWFASRASEAELPLAAQDLVRVILGRDVTGVADELVARLNGRRYAVTRAVGDVAMANDERMDSATGVLWDRTQSGEEPRPPNHRFGVIYAAIIATIVVAGVVVALLGYSGLLDEVGLEHVIKAWPVAAAIGVGLAVGAVMHNLVKGPVVLARPAVVERAKAAGRLLLQGAKLDVAGNEVDLAKPFRLQLSREPLPHIDDCSLLNVVVIQTVDSNRRRAQVAIPVAPSAELERLPHLDTTAMLMDARTFTEEVWPTVRQAASSHGDEPAFDVKPL